jgi:surface carbohydrate biosynthesis protein
MFPGRTRWLLLPVDNFVREFHGKLLLAAVAAERGWGVIIAFKHSYFKKKVPAAHGLVIDSGFLNSSRVEAYRQRGWRVSAWDEEGLIYLSGGEYCQRRIHEPTFRHFEQAFLWGENQKEDIRQHIAGMDDRLVLAGNPRFDLLRPDLSQYYGPTASQLRGQHGQYILINTNFAVVNHYYGRDYLGLKGMIRAGKITTEEQQQDQIARENHQERVMQAFIDMLPAMSRRFPDHKIVVRPHPSENFDTWSAAAAGLPNVAMIHEGDVVPWLMGAVAAVHNSCTTGVQARILGVPTFSFMPVVSDRYDQYLPNAVSDQAHTTDELVNSIQEIAVTRHGRGYNNSDEQKAILERYVTALDGPWAAERVMEQTEQLDVQPEELDPPIASMLTRSASRITALKHWARDLVSHLGGRVPRGPRSQRSSKPSRADYYHRRFPLLSPEYLEVQLEQLREVTGRFSNVEGRVGAQDWVCIFPATG